MARTTPILKIKNNGTTLGTGGFQTIDLTGSLSATDEGGSIANVTGTGGPGGGVNISTETITATQSGTSVTLDLTTLAHTFIAIEVVFRNGQAITPLTSWTRSGNTITIINADASEAYMVQYTY